jgi:hypothetical protein
VGRPKERKRIESDRQSQKERPRIAALASVYRKYSHAQHILDRFLWGYGWGSRHHYPPMDLVSLYVDQVGDDDLSHERAAEFPLLEVYPSIREALTLGGTELAVDGVLLIAEHGSYRLNQKGQTLFPRYEWFKEIVDVYRASGRTAPIFNDKHLSWNWEWAKEMVETAKEMGFALMAGSSLPWVPRVPPVDLPLGAEVEEVLCLGAGRFDHLDFHSLEILQCMVERRRGGETGVVAVQALRGKAILDAMNAGSWAAGGWDPRLLEACLCRSHTLTPAREGFSLVYPGAKEIPDLLTAEPYAYRIEYADGLKATMLHLSGLVGDRTFAARLKGAREPLSTLIYAQRGELCNFFSAQVDAVEKVFLAGKATHPVERTLLTTGLTAAGVESLWLGQKRIETPHLAIRYEPTPHSSFRRT